MIGKDSTRLARKDRTESTRRPVAAEEIGQAGIVLDRARQRVAHLRDLVERTEEFDRVAENRREEPEADQDQTGEPGAALHHLAIEAQLLAEKEARAEHHRKTRPNRPEPNEALDDDLARAQELHERP